MPTTIYPPSYIVKPRKKVYKDRPIIAVTLNEETLDEAGTFGTLSEFIREMPQYQNGAYIVGLHTPRILARIQQTYHYPDDPFWQSKTTKQEKAQWRPELEEEEITLSTEMIIPRYCGWRARTHHENQYFYFLDPLLFYGNAKTIQDIFGEEVSQIDLQTILGWGKAIRLFCWENNLTVEATSGGIAAQFLTDNRFYPEPRRKVPKATNDRLRTRMPGNYCTLVVIPGERFQYNGHYIDQRRAHHYHAQEEKLPNANTLFAYGDFRRLRDFRHEGDEFLDGEFSGYVCGEFTPPTTRAPFLPPRWRRRTNSRGFVTTAEWPLLRDLGVTCTGVYAAWGSFDADTGLGLYAAHAERELDQWATRPSFGNTWLKPILVSTYGILAVNPQKERETMYGRKPLPNKRGVDPDFGQWPAGDLLLHGYLVRRTIGPRVEPSVTNVIHRGLIESATRAESLGYANHLSAQGHRVLMIHVDGVIVEAQDGDFPSELLIDPWTYKTPLTGLEFIDEFSFTSLEMTRMPGRALKHRRMVAVGKGTAPRIDPNVIIPIPSDYTKTRDAA